MKINKDYSMIRRYKPGLLVKYSSFEHFLDTHALPIACGVLLVLGLGLCFLIN